MKMATDKLIAQKDGAIGWITFNNPARHNALSLAMWQALCDAVTAFAADDEVRVIVLKGAGDKAFVSGADISEFEENRSSEATVRAYEEVAGRGTDALAQVDKPTIAMIRGYCIGGGMSVALSCDMRIAAEGSSFAVPAAKLGVGYGFKGVRKLVELVGPSFACEIFYTARQFGVDESIAMGLVNRVVPAEGLEAYVRNYAATIANNAPLTVSSIKTLVAQALKDESERDAPLCDEVVRRCFSSEDYREGRRAFMEKRKPKFTGR